MHHVTVKLGHQQAFQTRESLAGGRVRIPGITTWTLQVWRVPVSDGLAKDAYILENMIAQNFAWTYIKTGADWKTKRPWGLSGTPDEDAHRWFSEPNNF